MPIESTAEGGVDQRNDSSVHVLSPNHATKAEVASVVRTTGHGKRSPRHTMLDSIAAINGPFGRRESAKMLLKSTGFCQPSGDKVRYPSHTAAIAETAISQRTQALASSQREGRASSPK